MKEFLALSHGLTALYKACGRAGSSEMRGIKGDMELDGFGNCWWLSSCWLQLTTSKTPGWTLTGWLGPEAPESLFIHVSHFSTWWEVSWPTMPLHSATTLLVPAPKPVSAIELWIRENEQVTYWQEITTSRGTPGPALPVDLINPSRYPRSYKMLLILFSTCSVQNLKFGCRKMTDLQ